MAVTRQTLDRRYDDVLARRMLTLSAARIIEEMIGPFLRTYLDGTHQLNGLIVVQFERRWFHVSFRAKPFARLKRPVLYRAHLIAAERRSIRSRRGPKEIDEQTSIESNPRIALKGREIVAYNGVCT